MSVVEALQRELDAMPDHVGKSTMAASALALAADMDGGRSPAARSMTAKELRETMSLLRELAPPKSEETDLERRRREREQRLAGLSEARPAASS